MIRISKFPFKTSKSQIKTSDNKSTSVLLQAGFIRQETSGVYNYTTLWLRILRKIEKIVRDEMNKFWANEVILSSLSSMDSWKKTWRDAIPEYFKVPTWWDSFYRLNPTHEEIVVPLMKEFLESYKDTESCVYQIQTKYRNEKRAKSWLLRWREFLMKDAYSFHLDDEGFQKYYDDMKKVYTNIFEKLGIGKDTYITLADGWGFTERFSHEFQTLLPIWEDTIYIDEESLECFNKEVAPAKVWKDLKKPKRRSKRKKRHTMRMNYMSKWAIWISWYRGGRDYKNYIIWNR